MADAKPLTAKEAKRLCALAEIQGDEVAAQWWRGEVLRLTNAAAYAKWLEQRQAEWREQFERDG